MKVLAVDTSSPFGAVGLLDDDEEIAELSFRTRESYSSRLLPVIDMLLRTTETDLGEIDLFGLVTGPGSFTGLRIAAAAAQGLGLASGLPLLPVSSLTATAQGLWRVHGIPSALVCVDAHMGEVFWAGFEIRNGLAWVVGEEHLSAPAAVSSAGLADWTAAGTGFAAYEAILAPLAASARDVLVGVRPRATDLFPQAELDLVTGRGRRPEEATPVYLRSEAAWER